MFKKYRNWVFVADTNNGNIYKFRLTSDRDGFVFNEYHLQDNVLYTTHGGNMPHEFNMFNINDCCFYSNSDDSPQRCNNF